MKQVIKKISLAIMATALMAPASLLAQKEDKDKESKDKKKDTEQIIITRTTGNEDKIVIEVVGDKVTVNGKEIDKHDKSGEVTVTRHKIKDMWSYGQNHNDNAFTMNNGAFWKTDENKAMLGVTTEETEQGAEIKDVTKESGAEKAGLKEGDIITKIDDKKIKGPDDLSEVIRSHKPGDKVAVTYLRDKKESKVTAETSKWKGVSVYTTSPNTNFNMNLGDLDLADVMPKIQSMRTPYAPYSFSWSGGGPKLGLSVQDSEDGKGVKVLEVDEDGNAGKAGIKEDDVITEVDGKAVNGADEIAKVMKDNKDKISVKMKYTRGGKSETVDVKIPRKLKSADL